METSVYRNLESSMKMSWSVRDSFLECVGPHLGVLVKVG